LLLLLLLFDAATDFGDAAAAPVFDEDDALDVFVETGFGGAGEEVDDEVDDEESDDVEDELDEVLSRPALEASCWCWCCCWCFSSLVSSLR